MKCKTGIGLMITKVLIRNGMTVIISSRKKKVCDEVAALINSTPAYSMGKCVSIPADISDEKGCQKLAEQVRI
jgi:NAD(P)-dependent dehydrogenase (short-subunit alcohol dehydrogenase family)